MAYSFIDTLFANGDDMDPSPFWVLMALCWFVNEKKATSTTGACWPSIKKIAAKAHVSELTARKSIKVLMEKKFITAHQPPGKVRVFYVDFSRIKELAGGKDLEGVKDVSGGKDLEGVKDVSGVKDLEGVKDVSGGKDLEGDPLKMLKGRGERSLPPPLKDLEAEQGIEQGIEQGRVAHACASAVSTTPPVVDDEAEAEWNDLTARAALEADSMPEDVFSPDAQTPVENIEILNATASDSIFGTDTPTKDQDASERKSEGTSKPKRRKRVALTLTELPIDWRMYCERTAPELNPERVWDDFSDFWQNRAKDPLCVDWSRTWQTNVRKLHALPNNDFRKAPQLKQEIAKAAPPKPSRFMTAQERYEAELDRLGQISDEEYFARIKRAGEEFVRRDQERAARLAQEKAKKEKNQ